MSIREKTDQIRGCLFLAVSVLLLAASLAFGGLPGESGNHRLQQEPATAATNLGE